MSAVTQEGENKRDDSLKVLSADGLEVQMDATVIYRIDTDTGEEVEIDVDDYTPVIQLKSEVRISCYQEDV